MSCDQHCEPRWNTGTHKFCCAESRYSIATYIQRKLEVGAVKGASPCNLRALLESEIPNRFNLINVGLELIFAYHLV